MGLKQNALVHNNESLKYSKIIDKVLINVNDHLTVLMNQLLSSADNMLFGLAETATTDEERMKYMDCTYIFRTEKKMILASTFLSI